MKKPTADINEETEVKTRIPVWLYPSTLGTIDRAMEVCSCKSRSEYLEKAALFYAGYVSGQDACAYLPPALVTAMRGTIQDTENRICRLLFKQAVEQDMMMNIMAAGIDLSTEDMERLRARCVKEVKKTSGAISFTDALDYQRGVT
jgi:hypothetical protein